VGSFPTYEEAQAYRDALKTKGIDDAFIVAFNLGNKISLKEAKEYVDREKNDSTKEDSKKRKSVDF
jgi:hypothetical protein